MFPQRPQSQTPSPIKRRSVAAPRHSPLPLKSSPPTSAPNPLGSRVRVPMKLKINKACDLSSISVLPPHARNPSMMPPGGDGAGRGGAAPLRSQSFSQQSFSQGMSFSQSQNSFDDALVNDQKFGSQERENSSRRSTSLAPIATAREDSQLQLSRTSNNALQRWKLASVPVPDNRCQFGEEIDRRIRQMEGLLNRLTMILDGVQSDVMQVNRAVKEVALETEGIRQKIFLLDNSMQQVLKGEENIKTFLDQSLKSFPDEIVKKFDCNKLSEIAATVSVLPKQIEASLLKVQHEVCMVFTKEMEVVADNMQSVKDLCSARIKSPEVAANCTESLKNQCSARIQSPELKGYVYTRRPKTSQITPCQINNPPPKDHIGKVSPQRMDAEICRTLKPKLTASKYNMLPKKEDIASIPQDQCSRIIILDDESDGDVSCLLVKKETGRAMFLEEEAKEETMRILRRARKRQRRQNIYASLG